MAQEIDLVKDSTVSSLLGSLKTALDAQTEAIKAQTVVDASVDTALDPNSSNPIANSAVSAAITNLKTYTDNKLTAYYDSSDIASGTDIDNILASYSG